MTLEEIQESWKTDSEIDISNLDLESLKTPSLHSKYLNLLQTERNAFARLDSDLKILKMQKRIFFLHGATRETLEAGWKMPAQGSVSTNEVSHYIEVDPDVVKLTLKLALRKEKVEGLVEIIRQINSRNFFIKNAIEWIRFKHGLNGTT